MKSMYLVATLAGSVFAACIGAGPPKDDAADEDSRPGQSGKSAQASSPARRDESDLRRLRELARASSKPSTPAKAELTGVAAIRRQAADMELLVQSDLGRAFIHATAELPPIAPRTLYRTADRKNYYTQATAEGLDEARRKDLTKIPIDETLYYNTKYGTPLAYARPLDLLGQAGIRDVAGMKILDFGYGTIGHLTLLALLRADVVAVDVDPLLPALYGEPGDQGVVQGRQGRAGRVMLVDGHYPADPATKKAVGEGYDLILSKNTLKNGYLHPAQAVDKRMLVDLGVDDETFVRTLFAALKPHGRVMIYNICPAPTPPGPGYKPWSDGKCPFPRAMWERAGFRVIEFDKDDTSAVRSMARALGWDRGAGAMDIRNDLFAHYTLVQKP